MSSSYKPGEIVETGRGFGRVVEDNGELIDARGPTGRRSVLVSYVVPCIHCGGSGQGVEAHTELLPPKEPVSGSR